MIPANAPASDAPPPRKPTRRKRIVRALLYLTAFLFLALVVIPAAMAWSMLHPPRKHFQETPADFGLTSKDLFVASSQHGPLIHGWWVSASKPTGGTVIICHGIGDERSTFLPDAVEFARAGWDTALLDLRGHGESTGSSTMGVFEDRDIRAIRRELWVNGARPPFVLYGFSLGAVASLREAARDPEIAGVIADSAFCRIDATLGGPALLRAAGPLHDPLFRLAMWYGERFVGASLDEVRCDEAAGQFGDRPLLLIHGATDRVTPPSHSERIRAAASGPVVFWLIPGADHAETFGAAGYETVLLRFLDAVQRGTDLTEVERAIATASNRR